MTWAELRPGQSVIGTKQAVAVALHQPFVDAEVDAIVVPSIHIQVGEIPQRAIRSTITSSIIRADGCKDCLHNDLAAGHREAVLAVALVGQF